MSAVHHLTLDSWLEKQPVHSLPSVILIYGDDFLSRKAFDAISGVLKSGDAQDALWESLDGSSVAMSEIIENITTFSFLGSGKVIVVKKSPLFSSGPGTPGSVTYSETDLDAFQRCVASGLPEHHRLILVTPSVDKRRTFYKSIEKHLLFVDCSVPKGNRKADLDDQAQLMKRVVQQRLAIQNKTIEPRALLRLTDLTGFNLEALNNNIDKVCAFAGSRAAITVQDVDQVVTRDRKDPIFHLTNAVMEKKEGDALFYMNSLIHDGTHHLQILKSLENTVRRLLMVKCAALKISEAAGGGAGRMGFNGFKQQMMPAIVKWDQEMLENMLDTGEKTKGKKSVDTDLLLAPNPKNAYPVFQLFLKSEKFSMTQLCTAMTILGELDYRLKSSGDDALTRIESFIIRLCRQGGRRP